MNRRSFLASMLTALGAWGFGRWLPASAAPAATGPALLAQGIHDPAKAQVAWMLIRVQGGLTGQARRIG